MVDNVIKLDIGCGKNPQPGYTGVDAYVLDPKYVTAFMWDLPYQDGEVAEIFSSHALEHIEKRQVVPTLQEWYRVLKPGGVLILEVPDLVWCCENWLAHRDNGWNLDCLFGNQEHPGELHRTGFTEEILLAYLQASGFGAALYSELWNHAQKTLRFEVTK